MARKKRKKKEGGKEQGDDHRARHKVNRD